MSPETPPKRMTSKLEDLAGPLTQQQTHCLHGLGASPSQAPSLPRIQLPPISPATTPVSLQLQQTPHNLLHRWGHECPGAAGLSAPVTPAGPFLPGSPLLRPLQFPR